MKELVESQTEDIESAFTLDAGPYAVSVAYLQYKENPRKWVKQTQAYRQRVINRIHKIDLLPPPSASIRPSEKIESDMSTSASSSSSIQCGEAGVSITADDMKENSLPLSVTWKEVGLSEENFKGMWEKQLLLSQMKRLSWMHQVYLMPKWWLATLALKSHILFVSWQMEK